MTNVSRSAERSPSRLKQVVLANLHKLKEHRAKACGERERVQGCHLAVPSGQILQDYYDRWNELSELERQHVFRIEAAQHSREQSGP